VAYQDLVFAVLIIGFGAAGESEPSAKRLTSSQLKTLFVGHYIERGELNDPYPRPEFREYFRQDGEYLILEDNFSDRGSYRIANDRICVKLFKRPEHCRIVTQDPYGTLRIGIQGESGFTVIHLVKEPH
jgi:hypothetical protein